eukprot:UN27073
MNDDHCHTQSRFSILNPEICNTSKAEVENQFLKIPELNCTCERKLKYMYISDILCGLNLESIAPLKL